jgi:trigger factor
MQVKTEQLEPTKLKLTITADRQLLDDTKRRVLERLSRDVKVPGFRPGSAPANLVEKQIDPTALQSEFLDEVVNALYVSAVEQENLRPVGAPQIVLTKFVPFNTLEFTAEVEAVGEVKLPDYKKIKLAAKPVSVSAKDVDAVVEDLRGRGAEKKEVKRAAKDGDEAVIDFAGTDAKTKEPIPGADGQDYPLIIGSKAFIPGFEEELISLKPGDSKDFVITFPKDYSTKELQNRKVSFHAEVKRVSEVVKPKADDAFAAGVGPFKTLEELKTEIKRQLKTEREHEARQAYDNELLEKIADKTQVVIPPALVEEEIDRVEAEEKRNLVYRGQTWQEHLAEEGLTAEEHREQKRESAEARVKAGLVLGEISNREKVTLSPEELEMRVQLLKGRYNDAAMQAELDKPENRRDLYSRMMTEKTLDKLRTYSIS